MSVQLDSAGRPVADASNITTTLGTAGLGGTIGVRVTIDDAVITSKVEALLALESVELAVRKQTWPLS